MFIWMSENTNNTLMPVGLNTNTFIQPLDNVLRPQTEFVQVEGEFLRNNRIPEVGPETVEGPSGESLAGANVPYLEQLDNVRGEEPLADFFRKLNLNPNHMDYDFGLEQGIFVAARFGMKAEALIFVGTERVSIPLALDNLDIIAFMTDTVAHFYDTNILHFPRRAKLLDRVISFHRKRLKVQENDDHWHNKGIEFHAFVALVEDLIEGITDHVEVFDSYNGFLKALDKSQRLVFYGLAYDDIRLQSGGKRVLRTKDICNQSRELSARQLRRVERELIQRAVAKQKNISERLGVPHTERERIRSAKRKALRDVKRTFVDSDIEEESGLKKALTLPFRLVGSVVTLPLAAVDALRGVTKTCDKLSELVQQASDNDTCAKMATACDKVGAAAEDVYRPDGGITSMFASLTGDVGSAAETSKNLLDAIVETFQKVKESLSGFSSLLVQTCLAAFFFYLLLQFKSPLIRALLLSVATIVLGAKIKNLLDEVFKEVPEVEEGDISLESDTAEDPKKPINLNLDIPLLSKLVGGVLIATVFKATQPNTSGGLMRHVIMAITLTPRVFKGVETLLECVIAMTEAGVNAIATWLNQPAIKFASKWGDVIDDIVKDVYAFDYKYKKGTTELTPNQQLVVLMGLLHRINAQVMIHHSNPELRRHLLELKRTVEAMAHPLRQSTSGIRVQPASVLIGGVPGVGKTCMLQAMAVVLMKLCGELNEDSTVEQAANATFTRPSNSDYFDGYLNQFCYVIDDLFQLKPIPGGNSNEFADLMTFYGSFATMLNMAECEKKGLFPFNSKLLLMTTNCSDLSQVNATQIIMSEDAFKRRIDFHVELIVKPEYRKPNSEELDFAKFDEEKEKCSGKGLNCYPWHIWEIIQTTWGVDYGRKEGPGMSMQDFLIAVAKKIKRNMAYHKNQDELLSSLLRAPIPESWGGPPPKPTTEKVAEPSVASCSYKPAPNIVRESGFDSWKAHLPPGTTFGGRDYMKGVPDWNRPVPNSPVFTEPIDCTAYQDLKDEEHFRQEQENMEEAFRKGEMLRGLLDFNFSVGVFSGLACAAIGVAGVFAVKWAVKVLKATFKWFKELVMPKKEHSYDVVPQSNAPRPRKLTFAQQQSGEGPPPLWSKVYRNTFKAAINVGDHYAILGQVLFLKAHAAVMPYHFITDIEEHLRDGHITSKSCIEFRGCGEGTYKFTVPVSVLLGFKHVSYPDRDLYFLDFDKAISPKKDIMHHILRKKEIADIGGQVVRLDTARMHANGELLPYNERITFMAGPVEVGKTGIKIGTTVHKNWLAYDASTTPGDCGAVLSLSDCSQFGSCRLVAGLHVGRSKVWERAFATILDSEICEEALCKMGTIDYPVATTTESYWPDKVKVEPITELPFTDETGHGFGNLEPLFEVSPGVNAPVKSNLVPTKLGNARFFDDSVAAFYGDKKPEPLEIMKLGSYLDATGKVVFPMARAVKPFTTDVRVVDSSSFSRAVGVAMKPFNEASLEHTARTLSVEEAFLGVPSLGLNSIARQTSVGYPLCIVTGMKDKSYYVGSGEEYDLTTPEFLQLKKEIEEAIEVMRGGRRVEFVCRDFLKDETRKKGKDARLIAGTDLKYYALCRMYFGAYVAAHMTHHSKSGICVGLNPYSEWTKLYHHLTKKNKGKVWDGDFAGFDSSQQPSMLWPILEQMNAWYSMRGGTEEENKIRTILFHDLAFSKHIMGLKGTATTVVQWMKSLPSGHFLTAIVNSILSMSLIVAAWIHYTGELNFWDYAAAVTQGDDNLVSCCDEYIDVFNQVSVAKFLWEEYGMTYTAGRKGEDLQPHVPIEKVIFLQRSFAWKNGELVCPIRPESFLQSLYYTKKGTGVYKDDVVKKGLELALEELSMHSEEMWQRVAPQIVEAMKQYKTVPIANVKDSTEYLSIVKQRVPKWL